MPRHRFAMRSAPLIVLILAATAAAQAPQLMSAVSRKTHGAATFDIPMPLVGASGIECRSVDNAAGGLRLVLLFDKPISTGTATVAGGPALNGAPTFAGNAMSVLLTNVGNAQTVSVQVSNVTSAGGEPGAATVNLRTLLGDVNSDGSVTNADENIVSGNVGFAVDAARFRSDVNFSGSTSATDVNLVHAAIGTSVAGGATANGAPTISDIANQTGESGLATPAIAFAIADSESDAAGLGVSATSSNPALVPANAVTFGGSGATRSLTITPAAGRTGTATITVTVSDGLVSASDTFVMTVVAPTKLFLATMKPQGTSISQ